MNKYKYILLPADDRIRELRKDPVNETDEQPKKQSRTLKWYIVFSARIIFISLIFLPVLLISFSYLFLSIISERISGKKDGRSDQIPEKVKSILGKLTPWADYQLYPTTSTSQKPIPEDVPAFLASARKDFYRIIVYSFDPEALDDSAWKKLMHDGKIDRIVFVQDEEALSALMDTEPVDLFNSHFLFTHKRGSLLSDSTARINISVGGIDHATIYQYTTFHKCGTAFMFSRIRLPYNTLLDETVVLYFESEHHPEWNAFFEKNYTAIQEKLAVKGMRLIYFPVLMRESLEGSSYDQLLTYLYPDHRLGEAQLDITHLREWLGGIDLQELYRQFGRQFSIPYSPMPCLIHCIVRIGEADPRQPLLYSCVPMWSADEGGMWQEILFYTDRVRYPDSGVYYSLAPRDTGPYDPDENFPEDGLQISDELMSRIHEIRNLTPEGKMLSTVFHLIQSFREADPDLCRKLSTQLYEAYPKLNKQQSRLYIDRHFRIFLPDYGNIEIEMTPLPKTLFLFMLKYPDGIMFKELYRYKQELTYIYGRIGNRSDPDQIQKSIMDITDARSNSVNEKSSRIKEAFVSKIDDRLASAYYITGQRQEPKRITLDRSLVVMEESF